MSDYRKDPKDGRSLEGEPKQETMDSPLDDELDVKKSDPEAAGETLEEENQSWEESFLEDEDEDEEREYFERQVRNRKRMKKAIAVLVSLALLANVLAFWPLLYNLQAIQFLVKSRELSNNEAVSQYKQSVVLVSSESGKGTGFMISADGYIVTNHHVIEEKGPIFVKFSEGGSHEVDVVMSEASLDLAILKIRGTVPQRAVLPLGQQASAVPDMPVYVIGNPLFFNNIANEGVVIGEVPVAGLDIPAIALQAPIYKGNSGSPVINKAGEIIAIVFATSKIERQGEKLDVGLAIPVRYLIPYLEKLGQE
jgi:serine protease Do